MSKAYVDEDGVYLFSFDGDIAGPPGSTEVPTAPSDARQVWDFVAEEWGAIPPETPAVSPPKIVSCALRVTIADDEVSAIGGPFNIMTIMRLDVGTFWVFCLDEVTGDQPELVPNNGIHVAISEWSGTDFFIECRDHAGGPLIDPVSFGFILYQF